MFYIAYNSSFYIFQIMKFLVLGDSHARRLGEYSGRKEWFPSSMHFLGIGGATTSTLPQRVTMRDLHGYDGIFLILGSNDLSGSAPCRVAMAIHALARSLRQHLGIPVMVGHILTRVGQDAYNAKVSECNEILAHIMKTNFWKTKGLTTPQPHLYRDDGVHLNDHGNERIYRGVRGALMRLLRNRNV